MNCLAGLLPLTAGSIWQDERRIDTLPPERRGFGMVFQNYALFPHLTVRGNIAFGLRMRRLPKAEITPAYRRRRCGWCELEDHADKLPGQLSGGQQQRVAIARAVVLEPSLVLMDEPLTNLDAKLRLEMRTEIRRLHQSLGLTTVYVTHDQEEALSLADRLVVLREGRVQQIGSPRGAAHPTGQLARRRLHGLPQPAGGGGGAGRRRRRVTVESSGHRLLGEVVGEASRPGGGRRGRGPPRGHPRRRARRDPQRHVGDRSRWWSTRAASWRSRPVPTPGCCCTCGPTQRIAPGDQVKLAVDPQRLLVYPADASAQPDRLADAPAGDAVSGAGPGRPLAHWRHRLAERGVDRQLLAAGAGPDLRRRPVPLPVPLRAGALVPADDTGGPFGDYARFFSDSYERGTIWITLRIALPAALLNVLAAVPIAYRMRGRFRGKRLVTTLLVVPITLGTVLTAQGLLELPRPDRLVQPDPAAPRTSSTSRCG